MGCINNEVVKTTGSDLSYSNDIDSTLVSRSVWTVSRNNIQSAPAWYKHIAVFLWTDQVSWIAILEPLVRVF